MVTLDMTALASILIPLLTLCNTVLLVWNRLQVAQVHEAVNGAKAAAEAAAHAAGVTEGIAAVTPPPP